MPAPPSPIPASGLRPASAALALTQAAARLDVPVWQASQLARSTVPTAATGWAALDAELPGGGWPRAGLTELLLPAASAELALLGPGLAALAQRALGASEIVWIAPPARACVAALQALGLPASKLLLVDAIGAADAAWSAEQALRAGSCAAVLWWSEGLEGLSPPVALTTWRRLHLASQAGATPLFALRAPAARGLGSPAPLRLACTLAAGRRLAIEVFKRRGPPMTAPLEIALPWPASVQRALRAPPPAVRAMPAAAQAAAQAQSQGSLRDVVDRTAPAALAAASPVQVVAGA